MMEQFGLGDLLQPRRSIPTPQRRPVSRPGPSRQSVSRDDDVLGFGEFLGELFGVQPEAPSRRAAPPTATTTVRPSAPSSAPRARPAVPAQPANAGPEDLLMQMLGAFSEAIEEELLPALVPAPEQHRVQSRHPAFTQPSFAPATAAASQARPAQPTTAKPVPASSSSPFPTPGRTSSHISPNPHNARAGAHNVRPGAADEVADIKEAIRRSLDPRGNVQGVSTSIGTGATANVQVQPAPVVTPVQNLAAASKERPMPVQATKTTSSSTRTPSGSANASPRSSASMPIPSSVSSSPRPVSHPAPKITRVPVNGPVTSTPPVSPKPQPVPVRIPISTPSSSSKSSPTIAVPSSPALSTISTTSRSSLASLSAISSIEDRFTSLTSAFTFPEHLEFAPSASSSASALLYTATNAPVRVHEQALTRLLTDLDAVESGGDSEVRKTRKELVRRVESALEGLEAAKETAWVAFKEEEAAKDANEQQAVVEDSASTQEALSEAAVDEATPSSDTAVEEILPADTMVADNENSAPAITDDAPTVAVPSTETMETVVIPEDTVPESIGTVSEVLDSSPLEPSTLASEDLAAATPVVADTEASAAIPSPVRRGSDATINVSIEEPSAAAEDLEPEPQLPAVTEEDSNTVKASYRRRRPDSFCCDFRLSLAPFSR
ncbi:hypothetical protein DL93DRAFT_765088 [Clavulina sp. PMI_390]|nr:hypothetical protein DL93DRAFT_765088 [Clavulina sp. PMI_390]